MGGRKTMSVLQCDRRGCKNIMCDRLSYKYGYLCHECFAELVSMGNTVDIEDFMDNKLNPFTMEDTFEKWDNEFKIRV